MTSQAHNDAILERMRGVPAQPGTPESDADPRNPNVRPCKLCAGTGQVTLLKSWFPADGFRKERCGICGGSGQSNHRCDPAYVREQKRLRNLAAANDH